MSTRGKTCSAVEVAIMQSASCTGRKLQTKQWSPYEEVKEDGTGGGHVLLIPVPPSSKLGKQKKAAQGDRRF